MGHEGLLPCSQESAACAEPEASCSNLQTHTHTQTRARAHTNKQTNKHIL